VCIAAIGNVLDEDFLINLAFSSPQLNIKNKAKNRLKELGYE
jgi:hypothetical protein